MAMFQDMDDLRSTGGTWLGSGGTPFAAALRTVIVGVAGRHRGHVLIELDPWWSPPLRLHPAFFAIVREAMENAYRHAGRGVTVIVQASDDTLSISDNGRGFDPVAIAGQGGNGLDAMRRVAHSLGLGLRIVSASGVGTSIDVFLRPEAR